MASTCHGLRIIRRRILLPEAQLKSQFGHQLVLEMIAMVSDNLSRDTKTRNNLIEEKQCCRFTIIFVSRHGLSPLCKVIYDHYDILVIRCRREITSGKVNAPLRKRTDSDNRKKRRYMPVHLLSIDLTRVATFDRFNTIFEN